MLSARNNGKVTMFYIFVYSVEKIKLLISVSDAQVMKFVLMIRFHCRHFGGAENAGVENAGAITDGKP